MNRRSLFAGLASLLGLSAMGGAAAAAPTTALKTVPATVVGGPLTIEAETSSTVLDSGWIEVKCTRIHYFVGDREIGAAEYCRLLAIQENGPRLAA